VSKSPDGEVLLLAHGLHWANSNHILHKTFLGLGIQVYSNEGRRPSLREDDSKGVKMHKKHFKIFFSIMFNKYDTNFDVPDAHFDYLIFSVVLRPKKLEIRTKSENCIKAEKNQILCQEIEPNPSKNRAMHEEDNPSL
jgi:hypothetical protein